LGKIRELLLAFLAPSAARFGALPTFPRNIGPTGKKGRSAAKKHFFYSL
jgi:hypothetical protein